ncbi:MAG: nitrate ABC transporter permease [Bacteroidota bacterium]
MATGTNTLKNIFTPFGVVNKSVAWILIGGELVVALAAWQLSGKGLLPTPSRVLESTVKLLSQNYFYENFFSTLGLVLEAMGLSIVIAMALSYLYLIPFFTPITKFVMKCRYLTLTGLIFLFTLITSSGHSLKISLLIFGIVPFFVTSLVSVIGSIDVAEFDLCKSLRMSNWKAWWEVVIVGRLDQVFEVMRQNFAISWIMITMVEGLNMSEGGLGAMLIKSNKYIDLSTVFGILVVIFFVGICSDYLLALLRSWFFPYTRFNVRRA